MTIDTSQLGRAKELHAASILIAHGIYVFQPLVDSGFDLIATDKFASNFVPVQVRFKAKRTGFTIAEHELKKFRDAKVVLAYCSLAAIPGDGMSTAETTFWFVPIEEFAAVARQREDSKHVVTWNENRDLTSKWLGKGGLRSAFDSVWPAD
ncbi:hypothetical protein [Xanthomonas campestris]|uniref:hypothetical protein n=2 Tax=Xanthomonas campestris TaxID=339 RepID=UPI0011AF7A12|nr:hypothetical protein [Xanthomonas campestris]MCD0248306.1 hypothetical protein [Xanthomonas campestris pv. campestris]MCD0264245.1 hypothetical protein [Xanthomonas campestris pv. campestris]MCD0270005.1 hypothetical protein [Xanthomonas campestris pv. campestris]MCD0274000.1 hypothetical protein [Xanthomonas campestris pv. campestris]MCF8788290.1 hypothetical protein [Xanthomonas campestris pv. campestris]